ncbi:MAG TPA: cytochrome P450 [Isosphaeraceae bacterium]|jgi:cytochrome P450|nr:cytochrome P450 [Isosphaeraceae bacterium]
MASAVARKKAPGLRHLLPLPFGPMKQSRRDPLGFLLDGLLRYGDVFRYQLGPLVFHLVGHPDHVKHVLLDNQKNYPRSWYYDRTKPIVGEGLVTTEGAAWRRLRRMAQPAFHPQRVAALAGVMTDSTRAMLDRWQAHARTGETVDVAEEFVGLTLRIVCRALLSIELEGAADQIVLAVEAALEFTQHRIDSLVALPMFVPTPRNLKIRPSIRIIDTIIYGIIARRRREPDHDSGDLLSMLLATRDEETGEGLTDRELRDQILTFIAAGHETTAVALAWTFYLLSQHPEAESRLRTEVKTALNGRLPTLSDLPKLVFTRQVIEESLRLYPPVYALIRDAKHDDEIGGYHIPARSMVILSPYVTHRHPGFWPDPERFDPDRFSPERSACRPRFAWFPFLGGPHQCIGQEFAMMEAILIVAMVAQEFRLQLVPGTRVEPKPMLSLRPGNGLPMTIHSA